MTLKYIVTDYEVSADASLKTPWLETVNQKRKEQNLSEVTRGTLYEVNFAEIPFGQEGGTDGKVLECYPDGEPPFLFTDDFGDENLKSLVERYTHLEFVA